MAEMVAAARAAEMVAAARAAETVVAGWAAAVTVEARRTQTPAHRAGVGREELVYGAPSSLS